MVSRDGIQPGSATRRETTSLWRVPVALLCLWLLSPLVFAPQLEGYTAHLGSLALNFGQGAIDKVFPDLFGQGEYIYDTRIGVIFLFHVMGEIFGNYGAPLFHATMIASFAVFLFACIAFVKRFVAVDSLIALLAIVLIPGAVDTAFFFNDNMISAAFALSGLALICWRNSVFAYLVAGLLLGYATMCRTDAILVGPVIAGVCWITCGISVGFVKRGMACATGVLLVFAAMLPITGVSIIDAVRIGSGYAPSSDTRPIELRLTLIQALLGLPGLVLLLVGMVLNARCSAPAGIRRPLVLIAYPLIITAGFAIPTSAEVRHFYPLLTPILALHVVTALLWIKEKLAGETPVPRLTAALLLCGSIASLAMPPWMTARPLSQWTGYIIHDGPRTLYAGRLWMPLLWFRWQSAQQGSFATAQALAADLDQPGTATVLSTHYSDSGYLTLALFERGFRAESVAQAFPACSKSAVMVFRHDGRTVFLIRTENQYGKITLLKQQTAAFLTSLGLSCPPTREADRFYLTMIGPPDRRYDSRLPFNWLMQVIAPHTPDPTDLSVDLSPFPDNLFSNPFVARPATTSFRPDWAVATMHVLPLTPDEVATIHSHADEIAQKLPYSYDMMQQAYAPLHSHRQQDGI